MSFKIPFNHHHSIDCKCADQVALQFNEIVDCKILLDKKFAAVKLALEDLDLFND